MGLAKIKNPQLRDTARQKAREYMKMANPVQAALKDQGLTLDILRSEGLPMLRKGKIGEAIKTIPGSEFLLNGIEGYINNKAQGASVENNHIDISPTTNSPTRVENPFPPLKPR